MKMQQTGDISGSSGADAELPVAHRAAPWLDAYPDGLDWDAHFEPEALGALLDRAVTRCGQQPCTYFLGKQTTYAEIGALVARAARGLIDLGVERGVKVGLLLPNSPTFIIYYFAVLKAGGTIVNFNPLYTVEELEHQIRDSGTEILVTFDLEPMFEKIEALLASGVLKTAIIADFVRLLPPMKSLAFRIAKRRQRANVGGSSQQAKLVPERSLLRNDGKFTPPAIDPRADIAVLQYTGGTTGTPKGAMLTHANLSINVQQMEKWRNSTKQEQERTLGVLPLFHVFAMTCVMNYGIALGCELLLVPKFDLDEVLDLIGKKHPTVMPGVPTIFNAVMRHPRIKAYDLSSIDFCISGGAPLPLEVKRGFEALTRCHLVEGYGLSETAPVATCNPLDGPPREKSIGLPLPGTHLSIRSLEDPAKEMPIGEPGEICIAGPQVMLGYWNKPEETEKVFVGKYFRTGDVGYMDKDGYTYIVDRIKDMINASGFKIYPRRIEDALYKHPAIAEVTVVGVADDYRGEAPKAFVKLKDGMTVSERELLGFLTTKISKIEMPCAIEFRDVLPKTMIGKLSKKELRAEAAGR